MIEKWLLMELFWHYFDIIRTCSTWHIAHRQYNSVRAAQKKKRIEKSILKRINNIDVISDYKQNINRTVFCKSSINVRNFMNDYISLLRRVVTKGLRSRVFRIVNCVCTSIYTLMPINVHIRCSLCMWKFRRHCNNICVN